MIEYLKSLWHDLRGLYWGWEQGGCETFCGGKKTKQMWLNESATPWSRGSRNPYYKEANNARALTEVSP